VDLGLGGLVWFRKQSSNRSIGICSMQRSGSVPSLRRTSKPQVPLYHYPTISLPSYTYLDTLVRRQQHRLHQAIRLRSILCSVIALLPGLRGIECDQSISESRRDFDPQLVYPIDKPGAQIDYWGIDVQRPSPMAIEVHAGGIEDELEV
jgi:hypothetical protein